MKTIRIECAWCLKHMGTKEFDEPENANKRLVSHSICPACYSSVIRETVMMRIKNHERKLRTRTFLPAL